MARIVVYSMAYRGDVFPYVPIASELARRGHEVTYVVPREFHHLFEAEPFRCVHSGSDFSPIVLDEYGKYVARWGKKLGGGMLGRLYFTKLTVPHLDDMFAAIDAEMADADLLVSHPAAAVIGAMSCEKRNLAWVCGDLFPMLVPTATSPPMGMANLGKLSNRASWRIARSRLAGWMFSRREIVAFRTKIGLSTPKRWSLIDARLSPHLNLALVSPHYVDVASDWPENYHPVGFTLWNGPNQGRLADDVLKFLADGTPPVVVTLGTSAASANPLLFERIARQLDDHGVRGIFLTSNATVTDRVRRKVGAQHGVWQFVPLAPLLQHARAVVHSGAHGTNALALAAGLPSVIVPCLFDQAWHGRRQQQLGTGIWVKRMRHLPWAIRQLLVETTLAEKASALGERLRADNGTGTACDEIERLLAER